MADENAEQNENEGVEETEVAETEPEVTEEPAGEADEAEQPAAEAEVEPVGAEAAPAAEAEPEPAEEPVAEAAEEPLAEAEPAGTVEEPLAEAEPVAEAAEEPAAAPTRKKRKRLPRSERRQRSKPKPEQPAERKPITRLPKPEHARGRRQERQGAVVSAAGDKTIVVRVDTAKAHPMYKKVIRRSTRLHAHDEQNEAKVGDIVRIVETRPLSRLKRWRLREIVEAAK
jgi:small subunit ribosomal protein S17